MTSAYDSGLSLQSLQATLNVLASDENTDTLSTFLKTCESSPYRTAYFLVEIAREPDDKVQKLVQGVFSNAQVVQYDISKHVQILSLQKPPKQDVLQDVLQDVSITVPSITELLPIVIKRRFPGLYAPQPEMLAIVIKAPFEMRQI